MSGPDLVPRRISGLDGLRAVSILLVLLGHAGETLPVHTAWTDTLVLFLGNSRGGVLTFFVISGYLITYLLRRELEGRGRVSLRGFYLRRVLRIFPAFYTYLLVIAALALAGLVTMRASELLSAGTFTLNYWLVLPFDTDTSSGYWFIGHFWTLALEEQFYLLWPLSLVLLGLRRARWVAVALIALTPALRLVTYLLWPDLRENIGTMLHTSSDSLMIGCLLALLQGEGWFETRVKVLVSAGTAAVAALFLFVVSPVLAERFGGMYVLPVGTTLDAFAIGLILLYLTRHPASAVGKVLNARPVVFVGVLSYSLYLWQQLFLTPLNRTVFGVFPLNLAACFVVAWLSYRLIEKPFLRLRDRQRLRTPRTTGAASEV